jgi:hypothetical protein
LLQRVLGFDGQTVQFRHNEIHHIIGVTLGTNAIQVPRPSRSAIIEDE